MKIVLLRHGPPDFKATWLNPSTGHISALELYAASRVTTALPATVSRLSEEINTCVTSTLARSIDSARIPSFTNPKSIDIFNESELPHPDRLWLPVPWGLFLLIYRVLWLFGYKNNCDGKVRDRVRASDGSKHLADLAMQNDSVLLVGHGIMNRLICSELKKSGWKVDAKDGSSYWSSISLFKD